MIKEIILDWLFGKQQSYPSWQDGRIDSNSGDKQSALRSYERRTIDFTLDGGTILSGQTYLLPIKPEDKNTLAPFDKIIFDNSSNQFNTFDCILDSKKILIHRKCVMEADEQNFSEVRIINTGLVDQSNPISITLQRSF